MQGPSSWLEVVEHQQQRQHQMLQHTVLPAEAAAGAEGSTAASVLAETLLKAADAAPCCRSEPAGLGPPPFWAGQEALLSYCCRPGGLAAGSGPAGACPAVGAVA